MIFILFINNNKEVIMNFNFSKNPEYSLNKSITNELINLYGILTKFLVTEKINKDDVVFGDYTHLKSDSSKIYDIYMMPETSETFDSSGYNFSDFGLVNLDNINLFISRQSVEIIYGSDFDDSIGLNDVLGNLIVLPNNKIMEITNIELMVPGVNNLFTNDDVKSAYKLSCKPYANKLIQELDSVDISINEEVSYDTLDNYFQELLDVSTEQDHEVEVKESVTVIEKVLGVDTKIQKPVVSKFEDDVFGAF